MEEEAEFVYEKGAEQLILGTGQHGVARLSDEAEEFFSGKNCCVMAHPTQDALKAWNSAKGKVIGLFHITC